MFLIRKIEEKWGSACFVTHRQAFFSIRSSPNFLLILELHQTTSDHIRPSTLIDSIATVANGMAAQNPFVIALMAYFPIQAPM
jgi:hypothetical protein